MSEGTSQATTAVPVEPLGPQRLASIDAYRGLVMFLMLAESLRLCERARLWPGNAIWQFLCFHQSHVEWIGCSLHDLIQPSFSFLVGTALVFSLGNRRHLGQSPVQMTVHAVWRGFVLVSLGIFLRSLHSDITNFTFEDTLTQIGLGYPFLYFIGLRPRRDWWIALAVILVGYWAAFALYPVPPADFDYLQVKVAAGWLREHGLSGFAAHWQKNSNLAWAFDHWFLNLFPRKDPFVANGGGYATLSFIPTLATMILGLIAGGWLRDSERSGGNKLGMLLLAAGVSLGLGWALGQPWHVQGRMIQAAPVVKRIWTPSWVLYSGGWCFLAMGLFYALIDLPGWRAWSYPLRVIGRNSIAAYLLHWLAEGFVRDNLQRHFGPLVEWVEGTAPVNAIGRSLTERWGQELYDRVVQTAVPLAQGASILLVFWLFLWWMDRRKIYVKI